mmetsp:Transcript_32253/g.70369  ORF Transcript_32253/g.70369 Transcript_32253/m.70369 type:complete len:238 (+) Transcript_32253:92-805(+)|eukprot:CAMPEP_0118922926 /NCGR_PEP_ID=MMETSP1169-20130426/1664_1 /TAXON_ID=36882 /ORGANISM="Pyramimonas obovata, Strain CCMP722" /LENGTH=237 /DNA_ID=CAMNT_0006863855 /DNA_START=71 /DNA_END=784 /DNA_ORIENTATION=+
MAAVAALSPLGCTSHRRVKLNTTVNSGSPLRSWRSARKFGATSRSLAISTRAFSHSPGYASTRPQGVALTPSKGTAVGNKQRCTVVAGASALSLTPPTVCFTVAAVMAFMRKANTNLLLAVMALSIPASSLASFSSDAGLWFAFIGLALKTWFASWPAQLELPLLFLLLGITAPRQVLAWRVSKWAPLLNLALCLYMLYQHFSAHGLAGMFKGEALVVTAGLTALVVTSVMMCSHLI